MAPHWTSFLLIRLPTALLVLALAVEGVAALLSDIPRLRHPMDARAIEASVPGPGSAVLLFGDSVTQDVAKSFDLGPANRVRDLTANKASGMPGAYLLLRRYLEANPPPRVLAFAVTPEFAGYFPDQATADVYLTSVFEAHEEQAFLEGLGLTGTASGWWKPAILMPEASIFDRAVALFSGNGAEDGAGDAPRDAPTPDRPELPGGFDDDASLTETMRSRLSADLTVAPGAGASWAAICDLSAAEGIGIAVRWAPVPRSVWREWTDTGQLSGLEAAIRAAGDGACSNVAFGDFSSDAPYPNEAFRDADHLERPGWTGAYAHALAGWIERLEDDGYGD